VEPVSWFESNKRVTRLLRKVFGQGFDSPLLHLNMATQQIRYKNSHGSKLIMVHIDDSIRDYLYVIKTYKTTWPDMYGNIHNPNGDGKTHVYDVGILVEKISTGKGLLHIACSTDSYNELKARYQ